MHLELEVADRHPILDVAIQTIGLLDEQHWLGRCGTRGETSPSRRRLCAPLAWLSRCPRTPERSGDPLRCVLREQLPLRRNRKSFLSCSFDDTRTYRTASRRWRFCGGLGPSATHGCSVASGARPVSDRPLKDHSRRMPKYSASSSWASRGSISEGALSVSGDTSTAVATGTRRVSATRPGVSRLATVGKRRTSQA